MNNLWIFGCSISDDTQPADRDDYVKWKGYLIKTWSEILSKKIGYNLKNYAKSGTSNLDILESFSKHCVDIQNDDIVILNWTELNRFRIADKKWHNILAYHLTHSDLSDELKSFNEMNISTNTITEIIFNRENPLYEKELESWSNFINDYCKLKKIKIFFWGLHTDNKFTEKINNKNLFNYIISKSGTIADETLNEIQDGHFSEKSHQLASDIFYKLISKIT